LAQRTGHRDGRYDLLDVLDVGDVVYHWDANQHRFVGRSFVAAPATINEDGERYVELEGFAPIRAHVGLEELGAHRADIDAIRDQLQQRHRRQPLYLPFQFRQDGQLWMLSNYFGKLPSAMVRLLFGESELALEDTLPPESSEGADEPARNERGVKRSFLRPFKRKADEDYLASIQGGVRRHGRSHETLVNDFSKWLADQGWQVGCNAAIDIGIADPPIIIEAKAVDRWSTSIRQAVGQLYEYRYFKVADPDADLIFLASKPIPDHWLRYLEHDRQIGAAWRSGETFGLSSRAARLLRAL
jgi:hypothetical protein